MELYNWVIVKGRVGVLVGIEQRVEQLEIVKDGVSFQYPNQFEVAIIDEHDAEGLYIGKFNARMTSVAAAALDDIPESRRPKQIQIPVSQDNTDLVA